MRPLKVVQQMIAATLASLVLFGCGAPGPTSVQPTATSTRIIPRFISHTPLPEVVWDPGVLVSPGCACESLADSGCDTIEGPFGGLEPSYPIAMCWGPASSTEEHCDFVTGVPPKYFGFCYLAFQDDQFVLVGTEEELREVFAPIETDKEALSYVLAVMAGGSGSVDGHKIRLYHGLQIDPELEYVADVLEDTYVKKVADGYAVHLFLYDQWDCVGHPIVYAMDLHVTFEGHIEQVSKVVVYKDLARWCLD